MALRIQVLVTAAPFESVFAARLWPVSRQQCQYEVRIGHLHASLRGSLNLRLHGIQAAEAAHHDPARVERFVQLDANRICPVVVTADRGLRQVRLAIALPIRAALGAQSRCHLSMIRAIASAFARCHPDETAPARQRPEQ